MSDFVSNFWRRKILFVSGKGGVGKTTVSQAVALGLSEQGKRTLWITFDDPFRTPGERTQHGPNLWHVNVTTATAFEEYMTQKIKVKTLAKLFVNNSLIQYITQAAPGVHELVLLGKVWWERKNYDHVVVDMPSTGHGLAMFQSTDNFSKLFRGGAAREDAEAMLRTFGDPKESGTLIVALAEEMPLRESLELAEIWQRLFPDSVPHYIVNRRFPDVPAPADAVKDPDDWKSPVAASARDYVEKRAQLEKFNLLLWQERKIPYQSLSFSLKRDHGGIVRDVCGGLLKPTGGSA
ncbi:MAG: ArsA family ATPase [Bacteriovoracia bacterium]